MAFRSVAFLFLNGPHHVYHLAPTAVELARLHPEVDIVCLSSTHTATRLLRNLADRDAPCRIRIVQLPQPFRFRFLNFKKKIFPYAGDMFRRAAPWLRAADVIVATSHDAVKFVRRIRGVHARVVYQFHGCGDRGYSFEKKLGEFDLLMVPGDLYRRRLIGEAVTPASRIAVVGYPKLDAMSKRADVVPAFVANGRLTVLYTPHWDARLGSFKLWGRAIIDLFAQSTRYNLILAPHVLLAHWRHAQGYDTHYDDYAHHKHLLIDWGSDASVSMDYIRCADVYLGDVSSQVYEWIAHRPRPCVFLNAHRVDWENNRDYRFWRLGPVVTDPAALLPAIEQVVQRNDYADYQREVIREYVDINETPAPVRAAGEIARIGEMSENQR